MSETLYKSVPTLETDRLIIKAIGLDDLESMYHHMKHSEVRKYFDGWPNDNDSIEKFVKEAILKNANDQAADWVLFSKQDKKVIGRIWFGIYFLWCKGLNVGFSLNHEYWGQGITCEALNKVVEFGFEAMQLRRIEAWHDTNNIASGKVIKKCGFIFEGTLRERSTNGNAEMYAITHLDYYKK